MRCYIIEYKGDLPQTRGLDKPEVYVTYADAEYRLSDLFLSDVQEEEDGTLYYPHLPDPEDDRILIWRVEASHASRNKRGTMELAAHFSGWHWSYDAAELEGGPMEQIELPGSGGKTLYELATAE